MFLAEGLLGSCVWEGLSLHTRCTLNLEGWGKSYP